MEIRRIRKISDFLENAMFPKEIQRKICRRRGNLMILMAQECNQRKLSKRTPLQGSAVCRDPP